LTDPVPVERILRFGSKRLLSWPRYDYGRVLGIKREMIELGVEELLFEGPHLVDNRRVLGKGHTAVVLKARLRGGPAALKVRRVDAKRPDMRGEARLLGVANRAGVGPRLFGVTENLLAMELVEGVYLRDWLTSADPGAEVKRVLREFLGDAFRLDEAGLDHGELIRLRHHTILRGGRPVIIDFESASTARRACNLTTVVQSLFLNEKMQPVMERLLPVPDREELMGALRSYKESPSSGGFEVLVEMLGLGNHGD
jgi:predicted Ser/Thr protein kinase